MVARLPTVSTPLSVTSPPEITASVPVVAVTVARFVASTLVMAMFFGALRVIAPVKSDVAKSSVIDLFTAAVEISVVPVTETSPLSLTLPPETNLNVPVTPEVKRSEASTSFKSTLLPNTEIEPNLFPAVLSVMFCPVAVTGLMKTVKSLH